MRIATIVIFILLIAKGCKTDSTDLQRFPTVKNPAVSVHSNDGNPVLAKDAYYDKALGMVLGSAIGDAMGAPTEMWHRDAIRTQLGYVNKPEAVIREGSPEGPWDYNMPAGGTTDDTRWKYLFSQFANSQNLVELDSRDFAGHIVQLYLAEKKDVQKDDHFLPEHLEAEIRHMTWLQEWAKVAKPYLDGDLDGYRNAANRFYGGEMSCAGMLYAPSVGVYYPGDPENAYRQSFQLSLFDIGFARDISGLTAAYVSKAMQPGTSWEDIGAITRTIDPEKYAESRLVGRIAQRIYQDAKSIAYEAKGVLEENVDEHERIPKGFTYPAIYYTQVEKAYRLLDEKLWDIPFHAGEIHLINLTAIEFCEGDFKKAIEFVVNYGRDNDTVAAVTGAILGAYTGAQNLPAEWKKTVLQNNRDVVGIDLEKLAKEITEKAFEKR